MNPYRLGWDFIRGYRRSVCMAAKERFLCSQKIPYPCSGWHHWQSYFPCSIVTITVVCSGNCQSWDHSPGFYQPSMCLLKRENIMYTTQCKAKSRSEGRQLLFEPLLLTCQLNDCGWILDSFYTSASSSIIWANIIYILYNIQKLKQNRKLPQLL